MIRNNNIIDTHSDHHPASELFWTFGADNHPNALFVNNRVESLTYLWDPELKQFHDLGTIDILRQKGTWCTKT